MVDAAFLLVQSHCHLFHIRQTWDICASALILDNHLARSLRETTTLGCGSLSIPARQPLLFTFT